jgi:hypothetical protein
MDAIELILELHKADGTEPISRLPGLWHRRLDDQWEFWINGHMEPQGGEEIAQARARRVLRQVQRVASRFILDHYRRWRRRRRRDRELRGVLRAVARSYRGLVSRRAPLRSPR